MFKKLGLFAVSLLSLSALPRGAAAQSCVSVDTSRDTLPEGERKAALVLLTQNLQQNHVQVVQSGCQGTFTVAHVKFGNSITVFLSGPPGERQATASRMEDVPGLYSQLVRSLVTGKPMTTTGDNIDRTNVTSAQAAPMRADADSLWYVRLGYGTVLGGSYAGGPSFGFGYRYELDNIGIDVSFLNLTVADKGKDANGESKGAAVNGSWARLMGLYFFDPLANRSAYVGAGLSWGGTALSKDNVFYSGSGLQGELSLGYELLRASTIRIFTQLDAQLPFYKATNDLYSYSSTSGLSAANNDSLWAPSFVLSVGLGWGRGHQTVRVIQ